MTDQDVCPYCGGEDIVAVWIHDAKHGEIRLKDTPAALCHRCKTVGPYAANEAAAISAFCHPAHLLSTLPTYNPATHIVLSREAGKTLYRIMTALASVANDEGYTKIAAELLAALEVGE